MDEFSAEWKKKGLGKPASTLEEQQQKVDGIKKMLKEYRKALNPADARDMGALTRLEDSLKDAESKLKTFKEDARAGAKSRIDGLTKRIKSLKEGMAKDKKAGDTSHEKTDKGVLEDLEKQLKQAKKDLESYK